MTINSLLQSSSDSFQENQKFHLQLDQEFQERLKSVVEKEARVIESQHKKNKLLARERIELLIDPGTVPLVTVK